MGIKSVTLGFSGLKRLVTNSIISCKLLSPGFAGTVRLQINWRVFDLTMPSNEDKFSSGVPFASQ